MYAIILTEGEDGFDAFFRTGKRRPKLESATFLF